MTTRITAATAYADDNGGSSYVPANALDNNLSGGTYFSTSNTYAYPHWWAMKLVKPAVAESCSFYTWDYAGAECKDFKIQGSNNSTNGADGDWVDLGTFQFANNKAGNYYSTTQTFNWSNSTAYTWYRIYATSGWRNDGSPNLFSLYEFYLHGISEDCPDENTSIMLDTEGDNGSTTILDKCGGRVLVYGNARIDDNNLYLDGSGDYVRVLKDTDFVIGTGPYTVDFEIKTTALQNNKFIMDGRNGGSVSSFLIGTGGYTGSTPGSLRFDNNSDAAIHTGTYLISDGRRHHGAVVREGTGANQTKLYIDGVCRGVGTDSKNYTSSAGDWVIGVNSYGGSDIKCWLKNFRISKTALWTADFTPPTMQQPRFDVVGDGILYADSVYSSSNNPQEAHIDNLNSYWRSTNTAYPHWIAVDLGEDVSKIVTKMFLATVRNGNDVMLKDFILKGSNNSTNGSDGDWTNLLDSQYTNNYTLQEFDITNTVGYRWYKLYIESAWSGADNSCALRLIELFEDDYKNIIPLMTADNAPSPYVVSANFAMLSGNAVFEAFDAGFEGYTNALISNTGILSGIVTIDLGSGNDIAVNGYQIMPYWESYGVTPAPKTWTFEASLNGTDWVTLDTRANVNTWEAYNFKDFRFTNTTAYRYYRLNCTANNGSTQYFGFGFLRMFGGEEEEPPAENNGLLVAIFI